MDTRYLIVGGGVAADAACKALRYEDSRADFKLCLRPGGRGRAGVAGPG
jgi:hypothetical protein